MKSRDDIVQKKPSDLSRDAEECKAKLLERLHEKYLPRYGKVLTCDALSLYAKLTHSFLVKMGEKDEADLALQMSRVRIEDKHSRAINKLMLTLSDDDQFSCDNAAAASMYIAVLALIRDLRPC